MKKALTQIKIDCPVCNPLDTETADQIAKIVRSRLFTKDAEVYAQGDRSQGFHVVTKGVVKLFKNSASGKEIVIKLVGPGEAFGEYSIYGDGLYSENAQALEPTETRFVPRSEFLAMAADKPELTITLLESVCRWLTTFSLLVEDLNLSTARERVERFLHRCREEQRSTTIRLTQKKHEIALQLGIRPETLSRVLTELESEGKTRSNGAEIKIN